MAHHLPPWMRQPEPEPEPPSKPARMTPEEIRFWNAVLDEYGDAIPNAVAIALQELAPARDLKPIQWEAEDE